MGEQHYCCCGRCAGQRCAGEQVRKLPGRERLNSQQLNKQSLLRLHYSSFLSEPLAEPRRSWWFCPHSVRQPSFCSIKLQPCAMWCCAQHSSSTAICSAAGGRVLLKLRGWELEVSNSSLEPKAGTCVHITPAAATSG